MKLLQKLDFFFKLKHKLTFDGSISYSAAQYYLKCPYLYKLIKVFGITPPKTTEQIAGICTHKVLEVCARKKIKDVNEVEKIFDTYWDRKLPSTYYKIAKDGVLWYFESELKHADVLFTEKKIEFDIDGARVRGFVDRIDSIPGGVKIVDYKTYFVEPPYDFYRTDMQLYIYSYGIKKLGLTPIILEYVFIGAGTKLEMPVDEKIELEKLATLKDIVNKINEYRFEPDRNYCNFCPLNAICIKRA